jgi:hypothetical protein
MSQGFGTYYTNQGNLRDLICTQGYTGDGGQIRGLSNQLQGLRGQLYWVDDKTNQHSLKEHERAHRLHRPADSERKTCHGVGERHQRNPQQLGTRCIGKSFIY